ncbi:MAG: hypothetical protein ACYC96_06680 [Fimbriimonadaceae bacterium]
MLNRILSVTTGALCAVSALAQSTAVNLIPVAGNTYNNGTAYSIGYEFTVGNTAISVASLGYFDNSSLTNDHDVGIYDMSGNLLLSGTVAAGSPAVNYFAYTTTLSGSPALAANTSYEIMSVSGIVDPYTFAPSSYSTDPDVTFVTAKWTLGNTLAFGANSQSIVGFFGPNFTFGAPTPEPVSACLLAVSAFGLDYRRRMKAAVGQVHD